MANRRMFSNRITASGKFLKMPISSQALYFHLAMNADDDGVVEAFQVIRKTGANEDDLKVLASKEFIKVLNDDLVTFIMDWKEHNLIRADRKVNSIYQKLLVQMLPDANPLEQKPRADTGKTTGRPMDGEWTAQVRLGKVSIGKDSINTATSKDAAEDLIPEVINLFEKFVNPACKRYYKNTTQREAAKDLIKIHGFERLQFLIEKTLPKTNGIKFLPTITTPLQLVERYATLESGVRKAQEEKKLKANNVIF